MATLRFVFDFEVDLDGDIRHLASEATPTEIEITNLHDSTVSIAASTTVVLYDPTLSSVPFTTTAPLALILLSDTDDVEIEFTTNEDNAAEAIGLITLKAGVPWALGDLAGRFNYTTDAFAGTLDTIDKIRAKNLNADAAARVRMWIAS